MLALNVIGPIGLGRGLAQGLGERSEIQVVDERCGIGDDALELVARLFGPRAFVGTNGLRIALTGVAGWLAPRWTGAAADATGSYAGSFVALAALAILGALAILACRPRAVD